MKKLLILSLLSMGMAGCETRCSCDPYVGAPDSAKIYHDLWFDAIDSQCYYAVRNEPNSYAMDSYFYEKGHSYYLNMIRFTDSTQLKDRK